jgi:phosphomannomutase
LERQSFESHLGKDKLDELCKFCQEYIDKLDIPVKTSNHVERRAGMINVSPVGRACSREQRNEYEQYDLKNNIRKDFVAVLKEKFASLNLRFSIGG